MNRKDPFNEGAPAASARRRRSWAIALGLLLFMALIFAVTMVRLVQNTADRRGAVQAGAGPDWIADG